MDNKIQRDHEILHYFWENPNAASTKHALVLNDMYGIDHTVGYEQPLLTKGQIKMMHDELVKENEKNLESHSTPMEGIKTPPEEKHEDRWDTVLISGPGGDLTKKDIFQYYSDPQVANQIMEQLRDRPVVMRQTMDRSNTFLRRPDITKHEKNSDDPKDLQYWTERRATEFHQGFQEKDDRLVIDLDPGSNVSFDQTKKVTDKIEKILSNQHEVQDTSIQFSGNRGFYVWGYLSNKQDINSIRRKMQRIFDQFNSLAETPVTTKERTDANQIRIDLTPLKEKGSVKADGSLDQRSGYISKKIPKTQLYTFDPDSDARVNRDYLKSQYSFKNERLV